MSVFQMLYQLLIGPLELLFNGFVHNPGFVRS